MNVQLLKDLCAVYGPSGSERSVREFITNEISGYADSCETDAMGNLIAYKKGPGKKMMLAGHMDQLGLMVTGIDKEGFLRFTTLGGHNPENIKTQRVIFKNGTVGMVNCERLEDDKKMTLDTLYIDIGAADAEDAGRHVAVGDVCVFCAPQLSDEKKLISPAIDDRVGCFVMIEALKQLKNPAFDLYFVFTAQEEVGLRGARTSAYLVSPDYGIAFDVTVAYDTPKALKMPSKMYGGAAIKIKDSSLICSPVMVQHMERCAKEAGVKYQFEILTQGGTDSGAIQLTKTGVPSGVLSIPTRNLHSASEMCALSDVEDCISLTVKILETAI
jgi:endoglucanase